MKPHRLHIRPARNYAPVASSRNRVLYAGMALAGFILITFCAPLAGMFSPPGVWYASLNKSSWNPPSWIFGPVWTALYLMMAIAAWLVWKRVGWQRPLWLYFTQLLLNAAWTPVFFGVRETGWAFAVIMALWVTSRLQAALWDGTGSGKLPTRTLRSDELLTGPFSRRNLVDNFPQKQSGCKYPFPKPVVKCLLLELFTHTIPNCPKKIVSHCRAITEIASGSPLLKRVGIEDVSC